MIIDLFGKTIQSLSQSLDYSSAKNRAISTNIANVDTPNYKSKEVVFKNVLDNAMFGTVKTKRTHSKHIDFGQPTTPYQIVQRGQTSYNHNGNNVDIDKEMSELAKNQIYYQALVDRMNGKFNNLQTVIRGGR